MMQKYTAPLLISIIISALTIFVFTRVPADLWQDWQPATCIGKGCFCESADIHSPIRQMANTISSLGFVFSGALMLVRTSSNSKRMPVGYSWIMAVGSMIVGVGSAFYHASLTFIGQFFDVLGMFLIAAFILVYAWQRLWKLRIITTLGLYLTLNLLLGWLQFAIPDTRRYVFAVVVIIALLFEAYYRSKAGPQIVVRWLKISIGLMLLAYIIWTMDNTRLICFENSLLQGHALWHLLGAVSLWMLHQYYLSEK